MFPLQEYVPRARNAVIRLRGDRTRRQGPDDFHVIASDVDYGIIVCAAKNPDFNPRFIDRFLVALQAGNVTPVICITKSDLASRKEEADSLYRNLDIPIFEISVREKRGVDELKKFLQGKTAVFLGQSGAGKSSLIQAFVPDAEVKTQEVSSKRGTGKHTTTTTRKYEWTPGSVIIDTPGIRSLGVEYISKQELRNFFPEFVLVTQECKFNDCLHLHESNCAVKSAVANGSMNKARYDSYVRLMQEEE